MVQEAINANAILSKKATSRIVSIIRKTAKELNVTPIDLAKAAGITLYSASRLLNGKNVERIKVSTAIKTAKALGLTEHVLRVIRASDALERWQEKCSRLSRRESARVGAELIRTCEEKGISLEQLARAVGVTAPTLKAWFTGELRMPRDKLEDIRLALNRLITRSSARSRRKNNNKNKPRRKPEPISPPCPVSAPEGVSKEEDTGHWYGVPSNQSPGTEHKVEEVVGDVEKLPLWRSSEINGRTRIRAHGGRDDLTFQTADGELHVAMFLLRSAVREIFMDLQYIRRTLGVSRPGVLIIRDGRLLEYGSIIVLKVESGGELELGVLDQLEKVDAMRTPVKIDDLEPTVRNVKLLRTLLEVLEEKMYKEVNSIVSRIESRMDTVSLKVRWVKKATESFMSPTEVNLIKNEKRVAKEKAASGD